MDSSAAGANVPAATGEFTVLLKLHTGNFEDFFVVKEDLADLRFIADDDKTPLKFHVESFDLVNQLLYVWVKLPQIAANANTAHIWMYYGNAEATAAQDSGGSYDSGTALVYHFRAGDKLPRDASANGNHAAAGTAAPATGAQIAGGVRFDNGATLSVSDTPSLAVHAD